MSKLLSGILFLALAVPPAAGALTFSNLDPSSNVNDAVVNIGMQGGSGTCTGVLVAPTLVLTAGHCMGGAIVDGGSGRWNTQSPIWRDYNLPHPSENFALNPGWVSALRGSTATIYIGRIIAPFNYTQGTQATPVLCQSWCEAEERCQGWTYQTATSQCFLKDTPRFVANFGDTHGSPSFTAVSSQYSAAGLADMVMMRLDSPVPPTIATPARLLTHLPETPQAIEAYLRRLTYQAVGFSSTRSVRRTAQMRYNQYPFSNDLVMLAVDSSLGAQTEPGDSGSPLFATRTVGGRAERFVIGINQGPSGNISRYTLTGFNLRQSGQLLTFPYDRSTLDLRRSAAIGEWLQNILYADFATTSTRRPLYNWWGARPADNFLTSDPRWASDPRGVQFDAGGENLDPRRYQGGYEMYRFEGYVFDPHRPQPIGTVALWSWFNPTRGDNFSTTDPRWASDPSTVSWAGEHLASQRAQSGYTQYRLEGFIYDPRRPQPPNTRPLWSWFHSGRGDNFHTTDPRWGISTSDVRWIGENIEGVDRGGYRLYRLEGYVPVNPN